MHIQDRYFHTDSLILAFVPASTDIFLTSGQAFASRNSVTPFLPTKQNKSNSSRPPESPLRTPFLTPAAHFSHSRPPSAPPRPLFSSVLAQFLSGVPGRTQRAGFGLGAPAKGENRAGHPCRRENAPFHQQIRPFLLSFSPSPAPTPPFRRELATKTIANHRDDTPLPYPLPAPHPPPPENSRRGQASRKGEVLVYVI